MTDTNCRSLTQHLDDRRAKGLVDIKFYVHNASDGEADDGCREIETIFEAIAAGKVQDLVFED